MYQYWTSIPIPSRSSSSFNFSIRKIFHVWLSQSGNSIECAKSSSPFFITKNFSLISTFQQSHPPAPTLRVDWRRLEFIAPLCADLRGQVCLKEHRDHGSRQRCVAAEDQVKCINIGLVYP